MIDWKKTSAVAAAIVAAGLSGTASASTSSTITFDKDASGNSLSHGDVVYYFTNEDGVLIDRDVPGADLFVFNEGPNGNFEKGDAGVIYNNAANGSGHDPDDEAPYSKGNLQGSGNRLGNMLIVHEHPGNIRNDGTVPHPDDDATSKVHMAFLFDKTFNQFGFDIVDYGDDGEGKVRFYNDSGLLNTIDLDDLDGMNGIDFGNHSANRIDSSLLPISGGSARGVLITLTDSGAVDNVTTTAIPSPTAAGGLMLLGGLMFTRRRLRNATRQTHEA